MSSHVTSIGDHVINLPTPTLVHAEMVQANGADENVLYTTELHTHSGRGTDRFS